MFWSAAAQLPLWNDAEFAIERRVTQRASRRDEKR